MNSAETIEPPIDLNCAETLVMEAPAVQPTNKIRLPMASWALNKSRTMSCW